MQTVWFFLIGLMVIVYVVLDGFDLGAGLMQLFAARGEEERRSVLAAIGPVWDANEVWLVAAGGVLVFAFPRVYAAAFSGLYLPLMIVLWLLVLRGISIEFRSHVENPLWRAFWDVTFSLSSTVLVIVLGVALGNVLRGVPLDESGYFRMALFENFRTGPRPGAIDWYTGLVGVFAATALGAHGALYLSWKTIDPLRKRCEQIGLGLCLAALALLVPATIATAEVQPLIYTRLATRPWAWPIVLLALAGAGMALLGLKRRRELLAFVGWAVFVGALLLATAAALFPDLLLSTLDASWNLTAMNSATSQGGLSIGLWWWIPAIALATAYFTYLFRSFRGKVSGFGGNY